MLDSAASMILVMSFGTLVLGLKDRMCSMHPLEPLRAVTLSLVRGLRHLLVAEDLVEDHADVDWWR